MTTAEKNKMPQRKTLVDGKKLSKQFADISHEHAELRDRIAEVVKTLMKDNVGDCEGSRESDE